MWVTLSKFTTTASVVSKSCFRKFFQKAKSSPITIRPLQSNTRIWFTTRGVICNIGHLVISAVKGTPGRLGKILQERFRFWTEVPSAVNRKRGGSHTKEVTMVRNNMLQKNSTHLEVGPHRANWDRQGRAETRGRSNRRVERAGQIRSEGLMGAAQR